MTLQKYIYSSDSGLKPFVDAEKRIREMGDLWMSYLERGVGIQGNFYLEDMAQKTSCPRFAEAIISLVADDIAKNNPIFLAPSKNGKKPNEYIFKKSKGMPFDYTISRKKWNDSINLFISNWYK